VLHYSNELYKDIRSCNAQVVKSDNCKLYPENNDYISFFLNRLGLKNILKLRKAGFKNYSADILFEYGIKDISNMNNFILYSTKEEHQFEKDNWDKYTKDAKSRDEFLKAKARYKQALIEHMKQCKCSRIPMSYDELMNHPNIADYMNVDKYVDINIKEGSKSQYVTYIPHVQVQSNLPNEWEFVNLINVKEKYEIKRIFPKDKEVNQFCGLYGKIFKVKYSSNDFKFHSKSSIVMGLFDVNGKLLSGCRYKIISADFNEYKADGDYMFLSDFMSVGNNNGTKLLPHIIDVAFIKDMDIVLKAWKDDLIPYYEKYGFELIAGRVMVNRKK
jgi:hypothetical protein